jgi:small subunit ribosomal protein S7e
MQRITRENPTSLELQVCQHLQDLEQLKELKQDLRGLQITQVKEVSTKGIHALVIFVPPPMLKQYRKIQSRLVRELEKKFSDCHVVFCASRRILSKPTRQARVKQQRPRSRTLTSVHEKLLEDIVFPTEIVGKRTRQHVDGSRLLKVILDKKDATSLEYKFDTFSACYKQLTGKQVVFEFPTAE